MAERIQRGIIRPQLLDRRDVAGYFRLFGRRGLDPDVAAFAATSGATDLTGLNNLVVYLKAQSLYDDFVIYPMKSAQNAGSGATVYSLGGLTTNDMTIVNSPTWGAGGISFNGTNQYGFIEDFLTDTSLTVFNRVTIDSPDTTARVVWGYFNPNLDNQGAIISSLEVTGTNKIQLLRSSDGGSTNREIYRGDPSSLTDICYVAEWTYGGGRQLWQDNTNLPLTLEAGSAQTSMFDASSRITVGAFENNTTPQNFWDGESHASVVFNATLTTTQREAITDLINAL